MAYSYTDEDGRLVFHFRGIARETLLAIFDFLCPANGKGLAHGYYAFWEHDPAYIHGHGYHRIAVEVKGRNDYFCSLQDFCLMIETHFRSVAVGDSYIARFSMDKFLNLSSASMKKKTNEEKQS